MGYTASMKFEQKKIINRLKRVQGQIDALADAIETNNSCDTVVPQFLAVRGAISSALLTYLELSIADCSKNSPDKLQDLITTLIKK